MKEIKDIQEIDFKYIEMLQNTIENNEEQQEEHEEI